LTSELDGEWSSSRPGRFNPLESVPGTYWIGGPVLYIFKWNFISRTLCMYTSYWPWWC